MIRKLVLSAVLLTALFMFAGVAAAGDDDIDEPVVDCTGASVTFHVPQFNSWSWSLTVDGSFVNADSGFNESQGAQDVTATNVGGENDPFPFTEGDHNASFFITITPSGRAVAPTISVDFSCDGDPTLPPLTTGRACFGPGEVAAAVFVTGSAVEVWTIDPSDNGELAIRVLKDDLFALYTPGTPVKVEEADKYIHVELWMQANGFPRVTAGPDAEGKIFDCVFGARYSKVRSYFPGGVGPDEVVPDEPTATPTPDTGDDDTDK